MRVLFCMSHDGYVRNFEEVLSELVDRGHSVHLGLMRREPLLMSTFESVETLCAAKPGLSLDLAPSGRDGDLGALLEAFCASRDYLRYLRPEYAAAPKLRERAASFAPPPLRRLASLVRRRWALELLDRALRGTMRRVPVDPDLQRYVRSHAPDVALFTPLVGFGLEQHALLRAAQAAGVPAALLVHSWDNLTNKGLIHWSPDRVVVWNDDQRREAVDHHGVADERIVVTGAHSYDDWFERSPSTSREEFCRAAGLDPARPYVLYVCSSRFIAPAESHFVARWVQLLREADDAPLREVGVLVRSHPQNDEHWREVALHDSGRTVLWPAPGTARSGALARAAYYDSLHHCAAVVGVNTSALLEAAIVGRPVLTLLAPEFRKTQEGTLHFAYLARARDGLLTIARTDGEHAEQLARALGGPGDNARRARRFVERFIRPHGLGQPAAPGVADSVEELARLPVPSARLAGRSRRQPVLAAAARYAGRRREALRAERRGAVAGR